MHILHCVGCTKGSVQAIGNRNLLNKSSEEFLVSPPNSSLEDYTFSAVRDCLFSTFKLLSILVADFNPQSEGSPAKELGTTL